jgi:hypothetical protein
MEGTEGVKDPESPPGKKHEETVPYVRFEQANEEAKREREARIRAEERARTLEATKVPEKPESKIYTRQELRQMVTENKISQDQMDEYMEAKLRAELQQDVVKVGNERERSTKVLQEIARYKSHIPDIAKDGTEDRIKVEKEFQYLVAHGQPKSESTELAALRAVYGPVEKLEKKRVLDERESFQDVGNGSKPEDKGNSPFKNLPQRYKDHYEKQIAKGIYKGWDDPRIKKEIDRIPTETLVRRQAKFS